MLNEQLTRMTPFSHIDQPGLSWRTEAAKELLRINPAFSLERLAQTTPHKDRAVADRFIEALRKAGLK
jgi:hypothetical protein